MSRELALGLRMTADMLNACPDGRAGFCVKTQFLDTVPPDFQRQCAVHRVRAGAPPGHEPDGEEARALRTVPRGLAQALAGEIPDDDDLRLLEEAVSTCATWIAPAGGRASDPWPPMRLGANGRALLQWWSDAGCWLRRASQIGVPRVLRSFAFETAVSTPAVQAARAFIDTGAAEAGRALGLLGPPGVGKDTGIVCGLRHWAPRWPRRQTCQWISVPALVREWLSTDDVNEALQDVIDVDVLVLADLGAGFMKRDGMALGLLEELIDAREAARATTFFSSNLRRNQIGPILGDRIGDRLLGHWAVIAELPGRSMRRPA